MPKAESGPRVVTEPHVQGRAVPGAVSAQAGEEDEEQTGRIHGGGGKRRVLTGRPYLQRPQLRKPKMLTFFPQLLPQATCVLGSRSVTLQQ